MTETIYKPLLEPIPHCYFHWTQLNPNPTYWIALRELFSVEQSSSVGDFLLYAIICS